MGTEQGTKKDMEWEEYVGLGVLGMGKEKDLVMAGGEGEGGDEGGGGMEETSRLLPFPTTKLTSNWNLQ